MESRFLRKTTAWKQDLAHSAVAVHQKLAAYYFETYGPRGKMYYWATVLDPKQKLESYYGLSFTRNDCSL
jgi:hypothetical protein